MALPKREGPPLGLFETWPAISIKLALNDSQHLHNTELALKTR